MLKKYCLIVENPQDPDAATEYLNDFTVVGIIEILLI